VRLRRDAKVELLRRVPLFERCSQEELRQIAAIATEAAYAQGEALVREGDPGSDFFVVLSGEVDVRREQLVGVTYHDPDGEKAYCYNSETASLQARLWEDGRLVEELTAPGRAHFEYAQREPVPGLEVQVT
jgi:cAMP-dependent protein kinase regulator